MTSFKCKDIGNECPFSAEAKSVDVMMRVIVAHLATEHRIYEIDPDLLEKIKAAVKQ